MEWFVKDVEKRRVFEGLEFFRNESLVILFERNFIE